MSEYETRTLQCSHVNLHKGRIDGCHTVCLDCGGHVTVSLCSYASGVPAEEQAIEMRKRCDEQIASGRRHLTGPEAMAHARAYDLPVHLGQGGPRNWQEVEAALRPSWLGGGGNVRNAWLDLPADKPLLKMSQQCRVYGDHGRCPGETTLGTDKCQCPCHHA